MSQFTSFSSSSSASVSITGLLSPTIQNVTITVASTEQEIALPSGTRKFLVRTRTSNAKMQLSYVENNTGVEFLTLLPGTVYQEEGIDPSASVTIYVQSSQPNTVVELVSWA